MVLSKLNKYISELNTIDSKSKKNEAIELSEFVIKFKSASPKEKIMMLLNLNEEDKREMQKLIDGGLLG